MNPNDAKDLLLKMVGPMEGQTDESDVIIMIVRVYHPLHCLVDEPFLL
jgi:hypothetical protein